MDTIFVPIGGILEIMLAVLIAQDMGPGWRVDPGAIPLRPGAESKSPAKERGKRWKMPWKNQKQMT